MRSLILLLTLLSAAQAAIISSPCSVPLGNFTNPSPGACPSFLAAGPPSGSTLTQGFVYVYVNSERFGNDPLSQMQVDPFGSWQPVDPWVTSSTAALTFFTTDPATLAFINTNGFPVSFQGTESAGYSGPSGWSTNLIVRYEYDPPRGLSQDDPIFWITVTIVNGVPVFSFAGPPGRWFDPPGVFGFDYAGTNGTQFTQVGFPTGFASPFQLSVPDGLGGFTSLGVHNGGTTFAFSSPVSAFRITGINPTVNSDDPDAFPTQLFFNSANGEFTMTPLSDVPEPSTWAMMLAGGLAAALRRGAGMRT